jgi:preprotein translocase subunit SecD
MKRITALAVVLVGALIGWYALSGGTSGYVRGLDLAGGVQLIYKADTSTVEEAEISERMETLRDAIENRVNVFGVSEPLVQVETGRAEDGSDEHRIIVELPGFTDVDQAVREIGKTPALEFKLKELAFSATSSAAASATTTASSTQSYTYVTTGLTGALVKKATLIFDPTTQEPVVSLLFDEAGTKLFGEITANNIGKPLAIFLDGVEVSDPIINEAIPSGEAVISGGGGGFTVSAAKQLVRDLNFGALPLKIDLIGTQTVGPTLGTTTWDKSLHAFGVALLCVMLYMIISYRSRGVVACITLLLYSVIVLATFKFIPVTLTASGFAGLILSLGIAVDANVLVFERIEDERRRGASPAVALEHGFSRAWPSIRDGNLTSLISAFILYWMSGASIVKGFSLVYLIGILASMISGYWASRIFLRLFVKSEAAA